MAAGTFGLLALFARALGGIASDKLAGRRGLDGRTTLLFGLMLGEGVGLLLFSQAPSVALAISAMLVFGLFTHMACGATYALMPFVDRKALGGVAGIIGAGGNAGAVLAGILNRQIPSQQTCLMVLGVMIVITAACSLVIRFSPEHKSNEQRLYDEALSG
ncbi:MAG: MFS transporter, partial [Deltaproteobacteria bacterium]